MPNLSLLRRLAAATALVPLAAPALAQTATPAGELPETVVTATRTPEPLANAPGSVSLVSRQDIRDSAAQTLDETLRAVPGIDLMGYAANAQHPTSNSLGMRGLGGGAQGISRALVMVDGVPINDPFFGYVQWQRVPVADIDHVEVVRGGGSPLWGNYAEGGVINIITRQPEANRAILEAGGGSYGTYNASGYASYRPSETTTLQGFVGANGTSGYQAVPRYERAPFNVPSSSNAVNLRLTGTVRPTDDLTMRLTLDYHENQQRLQTRLDTNSQQDFGLRGEVDRRFGNDSNLGLRLFYGYSSFRTNNSTYFPVQGDLASTTDALNEIHRLTTQNLGGSAIWSQQSSGLVRSYAIGADMQYIDGTDRTNHYIDPNFNAAFFQTKGGGSQLFAGGFARATLVPVEPLEINLSGRVQWLDNMNGRDGSLGGLGRVPDRSYTSFSPRADIRYRLPAGFALRGAYYQSFRAPNIGDLFYTYAAGGFTMVPNPLLKPETLNGGEVGLDWNRPGLRAQLTFYRTNVRNYIVSAPANNSIFSPAGWYVVQNQNIARVLAQGIETGLRWNVWRGLSANLGYRYADSTTQRDPANPAAVGKQVIDVPRHTASLGLAYQAEAGWRLAAQGVYTSRTAWASPDHTDPGYPGKRSGDPHFVLNLRASYPITEKFEGFVQVQNLLNQRYVVTSYSAPSAQAYGTPLTIFAGVRVTFDQLGLGQ